MRRSRYAKILATLGPASSTESTIRALFNAGADVFRLNFSHGSHADHHDRLQMIRKISADSNRPIGVVADLQGPKLRVGVFADGPVQLASGDPFIFDLEDRPGDTSRVKFPHADIYAALQPGTDVLLDDGRLRMRVELCTPHAITLRVIVGGLLSDRKGVNIPGVLLPLSALTAKDKLDLQFALDIGADWIALSFVQRPEDLQEARALIQGRAGLIAKFEKPQAIDQMDALVALSDAVMVARGDLGVEMPAEDVPTVQKQIIRSCLRAGKPVIVATQMLDSMIHAPSPTRAEASDVATAIYDGVDAVMLSAESASGAFPMEAVQMMDRIIRRVEQDPYYRAKLEHDRSETGPTTAEATTAHAITAAARQIAKRPTATILGITPYPEIAQRLTLVWGVHAVHHQDIKSVDDMASMASDLATAEAFARPGDRIVVTAGIPFHTPGTTNLLRVVKIGEADPKDRNL
jgi:pyruvate kinase